MPPNVELYNGKSGSNIITSMNHPSLVLNNNSPQGNSEQVYGGVGRKRVGKFTSFKITLR